MTGIQSQLAQQIESALHHSGTPEVPLKRPQLEALLSSVSVVLGSPIPQEVRDAALALVALSSEYSPTGKAAQDRNAAFISALHGLRNALNASSIPIAGNSGVVNPTVPDLDAEDPLAEFANDPELIQEFLLEAREHLAGVEAGLLTLEQDPLDAEALNSVFRSFHSIKGVAAFMGATAVKELAHETENLLDLARAGTLELSESIIDLILRAADDLTKCLDLATTHSLGSLPRCDLELLHALADTAARAEAGRKSGILTGSQPSHGAPATIVKESNLPTRATDLSVPLSTVAPTVPNGSIKTTSEIVPLNGTAESRVVRIETSKLEFLIDMVGELVIAESVVRHDPAIAASQDPLLSRNLTQLARVVQEVQKTSMSMRMVAIGTLFRKMSRLTRDLARQSGKNVELVTIGDDVELDRSIVEDLADPMVHMIRNAVDHGLELPGDRVASGKSAKGSVRLRAMHDAGDIVIEIGDDGRGMDPKRILAKARRLGLVGEHETPDEESIFKLIFEAGFSTADKVTDLSGRGVGMDVVKKQIQKLRGRISIRSVLGQGCSFVLRLPLTLAIIDGLVVGVGNQRFILPMFAVREMFSPKSDTFVTIENRAEAAFFRNKLLPVIRLSRLFDVHSPLRNSADAPWPLCNQTGNPPLQSAAQSLEGVLIVVEGRDQLYCIAVDQLIGKQEVVIKSLGKTFRDVPAISGGAILGDGRVGLIIDVNSLRYPK